MSVHFVHTGIQDYQSSSQWHDIGFVDILNSSEIDTSRIDINNPSHYITQFCGTPDPNFDLKWDSNPSKSPLLILLTHYNPLRKIRQSLSFSDSQIRQFLEENNGLPPQYEEQIISFEDELRMLSNHFNLDACKMANESDVIVCCWGEFMEFKYQKKHIFQGTSRGAVYIKSYEDRTEVQGTFSWY